MPYTRKLLGFTDNRQDAALQAGHFNDFLFVSLLRAGFLGALEAAGASRPPQRRARAGAAEGPRLRPPDAADPRRVAARARRCKGFNLQEAEATLRQVLAYRVWFDQRRGWRYTNPNLEQLGLVEGRLPGARRPRGGRRAVRRRALRVPRCLARGARERSTASCSTTCGSGWRSAARCSTRRSIEQMLRTLAQPAPRAVGLRRRREAAPRRLADDRRRRRAGTSTLRDEDLIVRGGSRSALGKALRSVKRCGMAAPPIRAAQGQGVRRARRGAAQCRRDARARVARKSTPFDSQLGLAAQRRLRRVPEGHAEAASRASRARTPSSATSIANLAALLRAAGASALRLRGARAHRAGGRREARGAREALPLRREGARGARGGREAPARDRRGQPLPAGPLLLADDGAGRRHLGAERRLPAQRAADAGQLRPAQRPRGPQRPGGARAHLRFGAEPARPVLLPRSQGDGARRGPAAAARPREPRPRRQPPPGGLARVHRAAARSVDRRAARALSDPARPLETEVAALR